MAAAGPPPGRPPGIAGGAGGGRPGGPALRGGPGPGADRRRPPGWRSWPAASGRSPRAHGWPARGAAGVAGQHRGRGRAREIDAAEVFVTDDFGPYGTRRDEAVETVLALDGGVRLVRVDSPYAVSPDDVTTGAGTPYKVFTPFYRGYRRVHGWPAPAAEPSAPRWASGVRSEPLPPAPDLGPTSILPPGRGRRPAVGSNEFAARAPRRTPPVATSPGPGPTPAASNPYLKFGCLHPRQVLAVDGQPAVPHRGGVARVVRRRPCLLPRLRPLVVPSRDGGARHRHRPRRRPPLRRLGRGPEPATRSSTPACASWPARRGCTNQVGTITASFLVKDLHIDWRRGAAPVHGPPPRTVALGLQPAQLAVGRRHRNRPGAVLPHLQPDDPGQEVRPRRHVRAAVGSTATATSTPTAFHEPWKLPDGPPTPGTHGRWWSTPRSAATPWPGTGESPRARRE